MLSPLAIVCSAISVVLAVIVPIALLVLLKEKAGKGLLAALVGALCFVLFALVLEQLLHALVLPYIIHKPVLYVLYASLAAGVFEETGRLAGLFLLCRKDKSLAVGLGYGVGHGGMEAILLVGVSAVATLVTLCQISAGITVPQQSMLVAIPAWQYLVAGLERIIALAAQVTLSVLIWMVVTRRVPLWMYPVAIGLHALVDVPAAIYQQGGIGSIGMVEFLTLVVVVLVVAFVWAVYRHAQPVPAAAAPSAEPSAAAQSPAAEETPELDEAPETVEGEVLLQKTAAARAESTQQDEAVEHR